nr:hypothetical protein [Methyloligella halotolerans]
MGLPVAEVDFASTAEPERIMALAEAAGLKAVPTGLAHGTVTVVADGIGHEVTSSGRMSRRTAATRRSASRRTGRRTRVGATSP